MSEAASDASPAPAEPGRRYSFFVEERQTGARLPTLEVINDRFSRYVKAALFQHLRRTIEVTPSPVELVKHALLLEQMQSPSYIALVNLKPLRGTMLLVADAELVVAVVESRFGGNGRFPVTLGNREFTPVEQKVMRRVLDSVLEQFTLAWKPVGQLAPEIVRHEFNPQFASVATANAMMIVSAFEVKVDNGKGGLALCIPHATLEPLRDQLMSGVVADSVDQDGRWYELLKIGVEQATMPLRVELAEIEMTVGDLLALRPGDVFEIDRPESVTVEANGSPLFRGRWGKYGRKVAVRIEERLSPLLDVAAGGAAGGEKRPWQK